MDCGGMFRRGGGGGGGGVVAVLHPILWIAACSVLVCTISQSHFHD